MLMENILKDLASKRTPVRKLINVSAISTVEIPNQ